MQICKHLTGIKRNNDFANLPRPMEKDKNALPIRRKKYYMAIGSYTEGISDPKESFLCVCVMIPVIIYLATVL